MSIGVLVAFLPKPAFALWAIGLTILPGYKL